MNRCLWLLGALLLGAVAFAQIGGPVESILEPLDEFEVEEVADGYAASGINFAFEKLNEAVYSLSGEGVFDEAGVDFSAALIGATTGYGESIALPVAEFFNTRLAELSGVGPVELAVQQYALELEVVGDQAPYDVSFSLALQEIPEELFPEPAASLGPTDARYVIREFSDFQCPFCANFVQQTLPQIKEELLARGDVRFEYHHFPLKSIHANALAAAEAAECVVAANPDNDEAFWIYHDALFERQQAWHGLGEPYPYFVRLAEDVGLESEGVETCLEERRFADEVNQAYQAGVALGIRGTPSVFVNGYRVGNFNDLSSYQHLIELVDVFSVAESDAESE